MHSSPPPPHSETANNQPEPPAQPTHTLANLDDIEQSQNANDVQPLHDTLERGFAFLASTQSEDGSWSGDYGGPMFLIPMYVIAAYLCERLPEDEQRTQIVTYIRSTQNPDGGVGIHAEAEESMMFCTVLCYVALRLLQEPADAPAMVKMRQWMHDNGTALGAASWAKWFLCLLNLYDYAGIHPILPELYLLPRSGPFHPGHLWCHARQVYLPMAYLYGQKACIHPNPLIEDLRQELYTQPYAQIDFSQHKDTICDADNTYPSHWMSTIANKILQLGETLFPKTLRERALQEVKTHIEHEDQNTHFIRIGPVNAVLNTLVHFFDDPASEATQRSWEELPQYLHQGHDGMKMNGYNSCKLWDTAFAVQTLLEAPLTLRNKFHSTLQLGFEYIRAHQVRADVPDKERFFRHASKGGWPFSDRLHGWPITDCTSEGFKAAVACERLGHNPIDDHDLQESIRLILSFQNDDGGWASYERKRNGAWLEWFNPSQAFRDIMVDYSYVECTSACVQALATAQKRFPNVLNHEVGTAIRQGELFLRRQQRPDGSFEGSWAVCFTYGTWFGVWGLLAAGVPKEDPAIQAACRFLLRKQRPDGAWSEHYRSCIERRYIHHPQAHVTQTAWALMTLCKAGYAQSDAAKNAAALLQKTQQPNGDWPREAMVGVFNKTTLINYENYRRYFPLWALSLFVQKAL
ncbi:MAG: terpene cyclase/mutase family protein [Myxococcota bacterium]